MRYQVSGNATATRGVRDRQEIAMMPLKWLLTLGMAVLVAAGVANRSNAGDWSTIKIGTEGAYAPFNFHDAAGKLQGFDIDLVQALCDRMGAKCEFVAIQFDGIIAAL